MKGLHGYAAGAIGLALILTACTSTATSDGSSPSGPSRSVMGDDVVVTYRFQDSSIPPQYHRSEELTVDRMTTRLVIDSYGDVLADESRPTPPEVWRELVADLESIASLPVEASQEGCVGGTSTSVRATTAGQITFELMADECAGANAPATEAIAVWIDPVRRLFPATEALAPTG